MRTLLFIVTFIAPGWQHMTANAFLIRGQSSGLARATSHDHKYIHPFPAFGALYFRQSGGMFSLVASVQQHNFPPVMEIFFFMSIAQINTVA
jgi:hypothetical protein